MADTRFTKEHEWIRIDGDTAVIGITDYAQQQLGDVVYVELPAVGKALKKGDEAAVVESVKAASEVYAPISGTVLAVNETLSGNPGLVNQAATGDGWFLKIKLGDTGEVASLMDEAAYKKYLEGLA